MVISLFSVFDPVSVGGFVMNWLEMVLVFMFLPGSYYFMTSSVVEIFSFFMVMVGLVYKEVSSLNGAGLVMMVSGLFFFVSFLNLAGLFPYIFTVTSHLVVTFSLGVVMWTSFFLMGWFMQFKYSSAHLVPEGAPFLLAPVMVVIEMVSHLIRPFTLSIRLAANIMSGHLILGLIGSMSTISFGGMLVSVFLQSVMMMLELAVGVIQAFVISILVLLYSLEYY